MPTVREVIVRAHVAQLEAMRTRLLAMLEQGHFVTQDQQQYVREEIALFEYEAEVISKLLPQGDV